MFEEIFHGDHSPKHWQTWSIDIARTRAACLPKSGRIAEQYKQFYAKDSVYAIQPQIVATINPSDLHKKIQEITNRLNTDRIVVVSIASGAKYIILPVGQMKVEM
ncbi:MAG: hypothetical protein R2911_05190 [Caldilineaceae bacterium]